MTEQIELILTPETAFLMGGSHDNPAYNTVTAFDKEGMPFLPATAVKGAIRMEFEAFALGVIQSGPLPDMAELKDIHPIICDLNTEGMEEDGTMEFRGCKHCLTCKLFGGGNEEGKLRFNAGVLSDDNIKTLAPIIHEITSKGRREGVTISRTQRTASEGHYYSTLTFPHLAGVMEKDIAFNASIDLQEELKPGERQFLGAFLEFLSRTGIVMGRSKSTGLGHFSVKSQLPEVKPGDSTDTVSIDTTNKELKLFKVTLITQEPMLIGKTKNRYIIDSMDYIPASTIGGNIGFNLARMGVGDEVMKDLYDTEAKKSRLSPFNLYMNTHFPYPASLMKPKSASKEDVSLNRDIMLEDYIIQRSIPHAFANDDIQELFKEIYMKNLREVAVCQTPDKSYITRVGIDRELQRVRDGLLYSMNTVDAGTEFQGLMIAEAWVKDALTGKHLCIGAKRTRGFGKTLVKSIEELDPKSLLDPDQNNTSVDTAVKELLQSHGLNTPGDSDRTFYSLDLLFDFFPPDEAVTTAAPGKTVEEIFIDTCFNGLDIKIEKAYTRTFTKGGYDFMKKRSKPLRQMIAAGSAFLVSVPTVQKEAFLEHLFNMVPDSVNYNWDNTPLFRLNSPVHVQYGGKK